MQLSTNYVCVLVAWCPQPSHMCVCLVYYYYFGLKANSKISKSLNKINLKLVNLKNILIINYYFGKIMDSVKKIK